MQFPRSSGILLHITSLPGRFGVGDLGNGAIEFIDFLHNAGQSLWQILPLGPPALGDSPYSCYSAFAGNTLLINPDQMAIDGWLKPSDVQSPVVSDLDETKVDYESVGKFKRTQFEKAFTHSRTSLRSNPVFDEFCHEQAYWLDNFARFDALMRHFEDSNWTRWPSDLIQRHEDAIATWDQQLRDEIEYSKFLQFVFDQQWNRVKQYANEKGIRIFGDMPIFVAHESSDVWANQQLFCLGPLGEPTLVAGVPPDYFSETGQLWGNPLYRWDVMEKTQYAWWTARFKRALQQVDLLRVDHFRGFESYWEIPATAETALSGRWQKGPKEKPFDAAREQLGELPIVAEDLGMITEQVHELRERLGFPAMRVMQFGFDDPNDVFHRPDHYPKHSVAYTGTHDNDTLMGWYHKREFKLKAIDPLDDFLEGDDPVHMQLIKAVLMSNSDTAIIPLQDALGLGSQSRMNMPGKATGNWQWRARSNDLSPQLAAQLRQMTIDTRR